MSKPSPDIAKVRLTIPQGTDPARVTGPGDALLRAAENRCEALITVRGDSISISGPAPEVDLLTRLFTHIIQVAGTGVALAPDDVDRAIDGLRAQDLRAAGPRDDVLLSYRGKVIRPKTPGQQRYIDVIREHTVTFCAGPAGTGKTYLAMAMAVAALQRRDVGRIVLTRPVVEAGENLGFLPGTLEEKVDPYVRPLYDALFDMMDAERAHELVERGVVEIAPLAYMRGRTLNDAFVILDEAQNTTPEQMKMFLTRLGFNSTFVITGDATQRDLPGKRGGITDAQEILGGVEGIAFVELSRTDVVRHRLVGKIVEAYEAFDAEREAAAGRSAGSRKAGKEGRHGRAHQ